MYEKFSNVNTLDFVKCLSFYSVTVQLFIVKCVNFLRKSHFKIQFYTQMYWENFQSFQKFSQWKKIFQNFLRICVQYLKLQSRKFFLYSIWENFAMKNMHGCSEKRQTLFKIQCMDNENFFKFLKYFHIGKEFLNTLCIFE